MLALLEQSYSSQVIGRLEYCDLVRRASPRQQAMERPAFHWLVFGHRGRIGAIIGQGGGWVMGCRLGRAPPLCPLRQGKHESHKHAAAYSGMASF
jgi:hypothetical protein